MEDNEYPPSAIAEADAIHAEGKEAWEILLQACIQDGGLDKMELRVAENADALYRSLFVCPHPAHVFARVQTCCNALAYGVLEVARQKAAEASQA